MGKTLGPSRNQKPNHRFTGIERAETSVGMKQFPVRSRFQHHGTLAQMVPLVKGAIADGRPAH